MSRTLKFSLFFIFTIAVGSSWADDQTINDRIALESTFDRGGRGDDGSRRPVAPDSRPEPIPETEGSPQDGRRSTDERPDPKEPAAEKSSAKFEDFANGGGFVGLILGIIGAPFAVWGIIAGTSLGWGIAALVAAGVVVGGILVGAGIGALIGLMAGAR
ncbi:MAG: hypothetical protein HYT79_12195 [Elusimicrobia bacterium]|nr:hypothetical protein [Elusimicrobiota bacterium]